MERSEWEAARQRLTDAGVTPTVDTSGSGVITLPSLASTTVQNGPSSCGT